MYFFVLLLARPRLRLLIPLFLCCSFIFLSAELTLFDQYAVAHVFSLDAYFHVLSATSENELIVCSVLDTLVQAISEIIKTSYIFMISLSPSNITVFVIAIFSCFFVVIPFSVAVTRNLCGNPLHRLFSL